MQNTFRNEEGGNFSRPQQKKTNNNIPHVHRSNVSAPSSYVLRGIYDNDTDPDFQYVKAFETAKESEAWYKEKCRHICTNPDYSTCDHIYTTLCDWKQVYQYLLTQIMHYRKLFPVQPPVPLPSSNRFSVGKPSSSSSSSSSSSLTSSLALPSSRTDKENDEAISPLQKALEDRLNLPFHQSMNEESTLNTLRYLFFHMKCGIFVMIRRNKLVMFVPFVNKDYTNTWSNHMKLDLSSSSVTPPLSSSVADSGLSALPETEEIAEYEALKRETLASIGKDGRREILLRNKEKWWANGNIICNVESPNFWGDSYLPQLRHMLQTLCANRQVPDVEFFINKRDFPHLKRNLTEPYDFIYDRDDEPLSRELYSTYAPIASFFVGKDFADLPLVTTDDWETATGLVFPPHHIDYRSAKNRQSNSFTWKERVPTAFFRGNSTGPGTDTHTNQRIALAALSASWEHNNQYNGHNSIDRIRFMDAGLVGWNLRDRKLQGTLMTHIKPTLLGIKTVDRVAMYAQMRYKYHIYVDGHCAAMRYASMMPLGAVILKIESVTKADSMWYFPLLKPYDIYAATPDPKGDHIPVKADLSNLHEVIAWCKQNDSICERIAQNSINMYNELIAKDGQLDYLQLLMHEIAVRFHPLSEERHTELEKQVQNLIHTTSLTDDEIIKIGNSLGCVPSLIVPSLSTPPSGYHDWFGAHNKEYVNTCIGPSRALPPCIKECSTINCSCPSCGKKRLKLEVAKTAVQIDSGSSFSSYKGDTTTITTNTSNKGLSSVMQNIASFTSSSSTTTTVAPKLVNNIEKARAAALKAASLAKEKANNNVKK